LAPASATPTLEQLLLTHPSRSVARLTCTAAAALRRLGGRHDVSAPWNAWLHFLLSKRFPDGRLELLDLRRAEQVLYNLAAMVDEEPAMRAVLLRALSNARYQVRGVRGPLGTACDWEVEFEDLIRLLQRGAVDEGKLATDRPMKPIGGRAR